MNYQYNGEDVTLLQYLEERLRKDPASTFFAMLAYFYLDIDKVGEALSVAQRGVIAHPSYSTGHAVLAMAMMRAGLYFDARRELQKADELHPGSKMIEELKADLDKQEQADSIGRKLAEQFRKNVSAGSDIMKTVEQTLKASPPKSTDEDDLIPGLDAIIGEELSPVQSTLVNPLRPKERGETDVQENGGKQSGKTEEPSIARAIIDRVAREFSNETAGSPPKTASSRPKNMHGEASGEEPREDEKGNFEFDVDILARRLESAGPIKSPASPTQTGEDEGGIELTPEIVTETLAMIFEQQGQLNAAIDAYSILVKKKPENEEFYKRKIAELTSRRDEQH